MGRVNTAFSSPQSSTIRFQQLRNLIIKNRLHLGCLFNGAKGACVLKQPQPYSSDQVFYILAVWLDCFYILANLPDRKPTWRLSKVQECVTECILTYGSNLIDTVHTVILHNVRIRQEGHSSIYSSFSFLSFSKYGSYLQAKNKPSELLLRYFEPSSSGNKRTRCEDLYNIA